MRVGTIYIFDADLPLGSDTINEADDIEGGIDTLDFSDTTGFPMNINLSDDTPPAQIVSANLDLQLSADDSIENVLGGQAGNTLTGNSLNNVLVGGPGSGFSGRWRWRRHARRPRRN